MDLVKGRVLIFIPTGEFVILDTWGMGTCAHPNVYPSEMTIEYLKEMNKDVVHEYPIDWENIVVKDVEIRVL